MSVRPTTANLKSQLLSLARVELVAKPCHYGQVMMRGVPELWRTSLIDTMNEARLQALYTSLQPTTEKVLKLLQTEKDEDFLTNQESRMLLWMKDFVRCLDDARLHQFLHFVTGTNTMPQVPIVISINSRVGLNCTPRAHTCGAVLEISTAYASIQQFKQEMNAVISSPEAMVMNIA